MAKLLAETGRYDMAQAALLPRSTYKQIGYRSFVGLIWVLWKCNRSCKRTNCQSRYEFRLPLRWI